MISTMMRKISSVKFVITLFFLLGIIVSPVWSDIIPVGSGDWTGSRTTPDGSGVNANNVDVTDQAPDDWTNTEGGLKISWTITQPTLLYHYSYTLTNKDDTPLSPALNYWVLEVSPFITADNLNTYFSNFSVTPTGVDSFSDGGNTVYGLKFSADSVSFDSLQEPVWGDFIVRDGTVDNPSPPPNNLVIRANSKGVETDPSATDTDFTKWIATPDTVPVPGSLYLLGSALAGLGFLGKKRLVK